MGKQSGGTKSRKGDRKARQQPVLHAVDAIELNKATHELVGGPPVDIALPLDTFRARLDSLPCGVCKEWVTLAWARWARKDADVHAKPWFADLQTPLSTAPPSFSPPADTDFDFSPVLTLENNTSKHLDGVETVKTDASLSSRRRKNRALKPADGRMPIPAATGALAPSTSKTTPPASQDFLSFVKMRPATAEPRGEVVVMSATGPTPWRQALTSLVDACTLQLEDRFVHQMERCSALYGKPVGDLCRPMMYRQPCCALHSKLQTAMAAALPCPRDEEYCVGQSANASERVRSETCACPYTCDINLLSREHRLVSRWKQSLSVRLTNEQELAKVVNSLKELKLRRDAFEELEEREAELERRREAGEEGLPDPDDEEAMGRRTEMFTAISEDSTSLFCSAYELCQSVLQRQQAAWQEEWSGMEHLADLPGGKRKLEREWECMTYWCECESVETNNEDGVRTQMDEIAAQQNAALAAGNEQEAMRLEDSFWDLDWKLYEMQWERIEWRINVLDEQISMLKNLLTREREDADKTVAEELGVKAPSVGFAHAAANSGMDESGSPIKPLALTEGEHEHEAMSEDLQVSACGAGGAGVSDTGSCPPAMFPSPLGIAAMSPPSLLAAVARREAVLKDLLYHGLQAGDMMLRHAVALVMAERVIAVHREAESERTRLELLREVALEEEVLAKKKLKQEAAKKKAKAAAVPPVPPPVKPASAPPPPAEISPVHAPVEVAEDSPCESSSTDDEPRQPGSVKALIDSVNKAPVSAPAVSAVSVKEKPQIARTAAAATAPVNHTLLARALPTTKSATPLSAGRGRSVASVLSAVPAVSSDSTTKSVPVQSSTVLASTAEASMKPSMSVQSSTPVAAVPAQNRVTIVLAPSRSVKPPETGVSVSTAAPTERRPPTAVRLARSPPAAMPTSLVRPVVSGPPVAPAPAAVVIPAAASAPAPAVPAPIAPVVVAPKPAVAPPAVPVAVAVGESIAIAPASVAAVTTSPSLSASAPAFAPASAAKPSQALAKAGADIKLPWEPIVTPGGLAPASDSAMSSSLSSRLAELGLAPAPASPSLGGKPVVAVPVADTLASVPLSPLSVKYPTSSAKAGTVDLAVEGKRLQFVPEDSPPDASQSDWGALESAIGASLLDELAQDPDSGFMSWSASGRGREDALSWMSASTETSRLASVTPVKSKLIPGITLGGPSEGGTAFPLTTASVEHDLSPGSTHSSAGKIASPIRMENDTSGVTASVHREHSHRGPSPIFHTATDTGPVGRPHSPVAPIREFHPTAAFALPVPPPHHLQPAFVAPFELRQGPPPPPGGWMAVEVPGPPPPPHFMHGPPVDEYGVMHGGRMGWQGEAPPPWAHPHHHQMPSDMAGAPPFHPREHPAFMMREPEMPFPAVAFAPPPHMTGFAPMPDPHMMEYGPRFSMQPFPHPPQPHMARYPYDGVMH